MWSVTTIWATTWTVNQYCNEKQNREWEKQCLLCRVLFRIDIWKKKKNQAIKLSRFRISFKLFPYKFAHFLHKLNIATSTPDCGRLVTYWRRAKEMLLNCWCLESHDIISHLHTACLEPSFLFFFLLYFCLLFVCFKCILNCMKMIITIY